jgi:hypothetical protein
VNDSWPGTWQQPPRLGAFVCTAHVLDIDLGQTHGLRPDSLTVHRLIFHADYG